MANETSDSREANAAKMRCTDPRGLVHVPMSDAPITVCGQPLGGMTVWQLGPPSMHEVCAICLSHINQMATRVKGTPK